MKQLRRQIGQWNCCFFTSRVRRSFKVKTKATKKKFYYPGAHYPTSSQHAQGIQNRRVRNLQTNVGGVNELHLQQGNLLMTAECVAGTRDKEREDEICG